MESPTTFLNQLSSNKSTAQYHFSEETLSFLVNLASRFRRVSCSTDATRWQPHYNCSEHPGQARTLLIVFQVLCIGTPTVFEKLRGFSNVSSHLADIDRRFEAFYGTESFTWFNMFNAHCFREGDNSEFWKFICSEQKPSAADASEEFLVLVDPPFGGLLGPLSTTIQKIVAKVRNAKILLVFPYFNEAQVL